MRTKLLFKSVLFLVIPIFVTITQDRAKDKSRDRTSINTTPNQRIIGTWQLENSIADKLEFTSNGIINHYIDNVIDISGTYEITANCSENTSSTKLYLKETDSDGDVYCSTILAGVYADGEEVLTLLGDTGKILVYIRQ